MEKILKRGTMRFLLSLIAVVGFVFASAPANKPVTMEAKGDPMYGVPNAPIIVKDSRIITLEAVGMGVAPLNTISPAQAVAMAKRAAVVDAARQMGEKLYGLKLEAKDRMVNMVLQDSVVNTRLYALVKNANVVETKYEDGLCQVKMELQIDGQRWYNILTKADAR